MKIDEHTFRLIEGYLDKKLSEDDRAGFEDRLLQDADLAEQVRVFREMQIYLAGRADVPDELQDRERIAQYNDFLTSKEGRSYQYYIEESGRDYFDQAGGSVRLRYLVAASTVIFLLALSVFYFTSQKPDYQHYYAWTELPSLTERSSEVQPLADAEVLFDHQEYQEALQILRKAMDDETASADVFIYVGICEFELGRPDQALAVFNQLLQSDLLDRHKAYWYKALIYLANDQVDKAVSQLQLLKDDDLMFYDEEAGELLEDLQ